MSPDKWAGRPLGPTQVRRTSTTAWLQQVENRVYIATGPGFPAEAEVIGIATEYCFAAWGWGSADGVSIRQTQAAKQLLKTGIGVKLIAIRLIDWITDQPPSSRHRKIDQNRLGFDRLATLGMAPTSVGIIAEGQPQLQPSHGRLKVSSGGQAAA